MLDAVLASRVRLFIFSPRRVRPMEFRANYLLGSRAPGSQLIHTALLSCFCFEQALAAYHNSHGLRSVSLRYFNAAGAQADGTIGELHIPETHLIPLTLQAVLETAPPLMVFGKNLATPDGTCVRDFVHVSGSCRGACASA